MITHIYSMYVCSNMSSIQELFGALDISCEEINADDANLLFEKHSLFELLSALNRQANHIDQTAANLNIEFASVLKLVQRSKLDYLRKFIENSDSYRVYKDFIRLSFDAKTELSLSDDLPESCCHSLLKRSSNCIMVTLLIGNICGGEKSFIEFLMSISPELILLLFQHKNSHEWTDKASRNQADLLLNKVLSCLEISDVHKLLQINTIHSELTTPSTTLAGQVFGLIKGYLTAKEWKYFPHIKESFVCLLKEIRFPHLSDHLELVLPPSLLVVDDFEISNKVQGVDCLLHIIKNVSSEELRWYGRADVIFQAIKQCLYTHEVPLIHLTHHALLAILKVIDKPRVAEITKYDDVFLMVLQDTEFENKIILRRTYTRLLHSFIDAMGITVIRHAKRLLRIFKIYLETYDGPEEQTRFNILKALHSFLIAAWPRICVHTDRILKILIRFIYDISVDETLTTAGTKQELLDHATKCLIILKFCDKEKVVTVLSAIRDINTTNVCHTIFEKTLTAEEAMLENIPDNCFPCVP